jgi:hypothetical protein
MMDDLLNFLKELSLLYNTKCYVEKVREYNQVIEFKIIMDFGTMRNIYYHLGFQVWLLQDTEGSFDNLKDINEILTSIREIKNKRSKNN